MPEAGGTQRLNLALQGGGSHGALTWGVLDALLEDGGFSFDGVSGTSAGAMNAVALRTASPRPPTSTRTRTKPTWPAAPWRAKP